MSLKQRLARLELWAPKVTPQVLAARLEAARQELEERWAEFSQRDEGDIPPPTPEEEAEIIREIRRELEAKAANAKPFDAPPTPHRRAHWRR